jgi:hypothetical protein
MKPEPGIVFYSHRVIGLCNDLIPDENPLEVNIRSEGKTKPSRSSLYDSSSLSLEDSKRALDISVQSAFEIIRKNQENFENLIK